MSAAFTRTQILSLYRRLLRQGSLFHSFNYRSYTLRRVRDHFRENKSLTSAEEIAKQYKFGLESLEMLQRQTSLNRMYSAPKLVVEKL